MNPFINNNNNNNSTIINNTISKRRYPLVSLFSPSRTVVTSFTPRRPSIENTTNYNAIDYNSCNTEYDNGDYVVCLQCTSNTISCVVSDNSVHVYDPISMIPIVSQWYPYYQNTTNNNINNNNDIITTDLVHGPQNTIVTTSSNGIILVSDLRTCQRHSQSQTAHSQSGIPQIVVQATIPKKEYITCISLGYDLYIAAVGTSKGQIHFIDLRKSTSLLSTFNNYHTDTITQLQFITSQSSNSTSQSNTNNTNTLPYLVVGSEDNLISYYDTTQPNEDCALITIINTMSPIRKLCTFSNNTTSTSSSSSILNQSQQHQQQNEQQQQQQQQKQSSTTSSSSSLSLSSYNVLALSGSETASLWNLSTGLCYSNFTNNNLRTNLTNTMNSTYSSDYNTDSIGNTASTTTTSGASLFTPLSTTTTTKSIDYLIDAYYDYTQNELLLAAGSYSGDATVFLCGNSSDNYDGQQQQYQQQQQNNTTMNYNTTTNDDELTWINHYSLIGGHKGIVRAWCPNNTTTSMSNQHTYTSGEDARICEWNCSSLNNSSTSNTIVKNNYSTQYYSNGTSTTNNSSSSIGGTSGGGPVRRRQEKQQNRRRQMHTSLLPY